MSESISLDIMGVRRLLPHRYPFLLVDRVLDASRARASGRSRTSRPTSRSSPGISRIGR